MKKLAALFLVMSLTGCMMSKPLVNAYNPAEYVKYQKPGTADVKGQAFLKTAGGELRFGAGEQVTLIPATAYSEEIISFVQNYTYIRAEGVDPRWSEHQKTTIADGSGNFEFNNVPAGTYWLECPIYWMVFNGYDSDRTGSTVYKKVEVHEGEKLKVILTE